jgi:hypothetical protein
MAEDHLQRFDQTVDRIKRQQDFGLCCYTFLSGIVDHPDRHEKYNNSFARQALDLCIGTVQTGLVLFCSRHWDTNDDFQSIPAARNHGERALGEIVNWHREFFAASGIERDAELFYDYFKALSLDIECAKESQAQVQIRVLRTEHYVFHPG